MFWGVAVFDKKKVFYFRFCNIFSFQTQAVFCCFLSCCQQRNPNQCRQAQHERDLSWGCQKGSFSLNNRHKFSMGESVTHGFFKSQLFSALKKILLYVLSQQYMVDIRGLKGPFKSNVREPCSLCLPPHWHKHTEKAMMSITHVAELLCTFIDRQMKKTQQSKQNLSGQTL